MKQIGTQQSFVLTDITSAYTALGSAVTTAQAGYVIARVCYSAGVGPTTSAAYQALVGGSAVNMAIAPNIVGSAIGVTIHIGYVPASTAVALTAYDNGSGAVTGTVDYFAIDAMSSLNTAFPTTITASSPMYNINLLGGGQVTYSGPVASDDTVTIYRGDNYDGANILQWTVEDWAGYDLTGATLKFRAQRKADYNRNSTTAAIESTCTHTVASTTITIEATPTITALETSPPASDNNYRYQIIATTNTTPAKTQTVVDGELKVSKSIGNTSGT